MSSPVVAMLHNTALNRWHPILFWNYPRPSEDENEPATRYKSRGHHTEGFDTQEAANGHAKELAERQSGRFVPDLIYQWDGEGVPAMIEYFARNAETNGAPSHE